MFPNNHNQYYVNRFQQETNYYDDEALPEEANEKYYDFQHHHQRQYEENQNDYLAKSGNAAFVYIRQRKFRLNFKRDRAKFIQNLLRFNYFNLGNC